MTKTTNRPLVSVVIPTYNRRQLLERAVESVRAQTYDHWELLIVDDGSADDTASYGAALQASEPRVRFLANTAHKSGPGGARNQGIELAQGELVAFLDSDDTWLPTKLQEQVAYFEQHPQAMALGSDCYVGALNEDSRLSRRYASIDNASDSVFGAIIRRKQFWIYTPTVILRRQVFATIGMFKEALIRCEDLVMWLSINQHWGWHYVPSALALINIDEARNVAYSDKRRVPEGYYHMLFIRDIDKHVSIDAGKLKDLQQARRDPDYLYWRGREKLQRRDPTGLLFYLGAIASATLHKLRR